MEDDRPGILIVEDDPRMAQVWKEILQVLGRSITCVPDGIDAIQACQQQAFAVILMDVGLPVLDGISTMELIHAQHTIPVILVTGVFLEAFNRRIGLRSGAVGYLIKPVGRKQLLAEVSYFLQLSALVG